MDTLDNKRYANYNYISRYSHVPYYFDTLDQKDIYGIGTQMLLDTGSVLHEVTLTDTLDSLALKYYSNPTYWWIIAYYNDIQDAFVRLSDKFKVLQIPSLSSVDFGARR